MYLSLIGLAAVGWFLYKSRPGLMLRAVGESPSSAYALGYNVRVIRFWAVLFGGFMSGLAGAYLSLVYTPLWAEGMTAGRGWIALAPCHLRHLASASRGARRLSFRRRDNAAVQYAGDGH